jgi:hypothetical protein
MLVDENAFGLLVSWFAIEDVEYSLEELEFSNRAAEFSDLLLGLLRDSPPGRNLRVIAFGHAVYVELAEGDEAGDLIGWLRRARDLLAAQGTVTVGVLAYGSRWVADGGASDAPRVEPIDHGVILHASRPSEPLRYVLLAEATAQPGDDPELEGWGPGLYVASDALEALGKKFKNAPTVLTAGVVTFYRVAP